MSLGPIAAQGYAPQDSLAIGEALGAVTMGAHRTVAPPPCQGGEALHGLSCERQKA
jgi:hypothetical protein